MNLNLFCKLSIALLLAAPAGTFAQQPSQSEPASGVETPAPVPAQKTAPDTAAPETRDEDAAPVATAPADKGEAAAKPAQPDKAAAYYHFMMAHMYEEMVSTYGRADYATKAIEEYRAAIENDPDSDYLNAGLAELYAKTGRIRDAVLEAQDILKRDGNNLEARRLLGRIYLRSLGDMQANNQSQEVLKLAIEQYEAIVKLDPKSVEDHLLLGRLYRINNELLKAETEFKIAVNLQPQSEDAVTTLAILYNEEGDTSRALQVLNAIPEQGAYREALLHPGLHLRTEQRLRQGSGRLPARSRSG